MGAIPSVGMRRNGCWTPPHHSSVEEWGRQQQQCVRVSVCACISVRMYQCAHVSVCPCISMSVYQCFHVSVCMCISVSVYLSISASVCPFICPLALVHQWVRSVYQCIRVSVH